MTAATATFLPGLEERRRLVRGVSMRWFEGGAGMPIVLLHGFGGAATNWTLVAPRLLRLGRVVVPDLPGHGRSSAFPAPPETLDPFADRVAALIEGPALVVGHSLGGVVALRLASRRPELVRGLVLAGCAGISSATRASERALTFVSIVKPGKRVARWRRAVAQRALLRALAFGVVSVADPAALDARAASGFLAGSALHTDVRSAGDALVRSDPRLDLARIRCPSLVLHGARDAQVPLRDAFEYARRLRAPLRTIADCGHLVIGERPDAVVDAISDGVRQVDERPLEAEPLREPR
jgi:pimeloyl-ACP methyl ester carboxylesterase